MGIITQFLKLMMAEVIFCIGIGQHYIKIITKKILRHLLCCLLRVELKTPKQVVWCILCGLIRRLFSDLSKYTEYPI